MVCPNDSIIPGLRQSSSSVDLSSSFDVASLVEEGSRELSFSAARVSRFDAATWISSKEREREEERKNKRSDGKREI